MLFMPGSGVNLCGRCLLYLVALKPKRGPNHEFAQAALKLASEFRHFPLMFTAQNGCFDVSPQMLLQIADDFIESVVTAACQLARHRKSNTLEVKDVQLHLGRSVFVAPSVVAEQGVLLEVRQESLLSNPIPSFLRAPVEHVDSWFWLG